MKQFIKYGMVCFIITVLAVFICPSRSTYGAKRKSCDIGKGDVVITKNGDYNLVGTTSENTIIVKKGVKANIWIKDLVLDMDIYSEEIPFVIGEKANVVLYVDGKNQINNYAWCDGDYTADAPMDAIRLEKGSKLTISKSSTGILELHANGFGSGIGGQGTLNMDGGTLKVYGGMYGAGIGNAINPSKFFVNINGGMIYAFGGIGLTESDSWVYENVYYNADNVEINDISAKKIVITGGMLIATNTSVTPVNKAGKKLSMQVFNAKKGNLKKITVDKTTYGCKGMKSNGFLALWTPSKNSKIEITYTNGKKDKITCQKGNIIGDKYESDFEFDVTKGSLILFDHGFIYKNHVYDSSCSNGEVRITGTTSDNRIIVDGSVTLVFNSVNVNMNEDSSHSFLTIGLNSDATLLLEGENNFQAGANSSVMLLGNHAKLSIAEKTPDHKLQFVLIEKAKGIIAENGSVVQNSGNILINMSEEAQGIYIGNGATYTLNQGEFNSSSIEGKAIHVSANGSVEVCGGCLTAQTIGYCDEANEEVSDSSSFILTNGTVNVANRMMFYGFTINDGELNCHLLGSGSGSSLSQYGGTINIDRFITNYEVDSDIEEYPYDYNFKTGELEGTAVDKERLYGGTFNESGDVTLEDMMQISFGRC